MNQPAPTPAAQLKEILKDLKYQVIKPDLVRAELEKLGDDAKGSISDCVERLQQLQIKESKGDPDKLLKCDICGGYSLDTYQECPFCDGKDAPPAEEKPAKAKKPRSTKAKEQPPAPPAAEEKPPKKPAKKRTTKPEPAAAAAEEPSKVVDINSRKKRSKKGDAQQVSEPVTEVLDSTALDAEVKAIKAAQARGTEALFEVGERMIKIRDQGLYTLRTGPGGKPTYKRMEDFTQAELGMSRPHAQLIASVVETFSQKDVVAIGVTKLGLFATLKSKETRTAILELARKGATLSDIKQEVRKLTGSDAERDRRRGFKGTPAEPRKRPEASEPITMATTEQEVMVPFLDVEGNQATKLKAGLTGTETTANGITITYELVTIEGIGVGLKVTRTRG